MKVILFILRRLLFTIIAEVTEAAHEKQNKTRCA